MTHLLGPKALACLQLAADHHPPGGGYMSYEEWERRYNTLCLLYSEKAVCAMFESLSTRGYTDYGVSARMGWPTEKGWAALGLLP